MHYAAAVEHNGRRDKHGHLWTRERELFCWRCDDCGCRLHGVKVIHLDYECSADKQISCTEIARSEPSIHLHETAGSHYWEEWPEDGEPMTVESLHERVCRLEQQRSEVLGLRGDLKHAESRVARLENDWWLQHVDGRVWHTTTLERWAQIKKEKAITVRDDGRWSNSWQHDNGYVCVWDFRSREHFDIGWASGGQSHIQKQTEPGTVWIEIDAEAVEADENCLSSRGYKEKMDKGERMSLVILGCEGGIKERVEQKHWGRVELITADKTWTTLEASIEARDCPSCGRTHSQARNGMYAEVCTALKAVLDKNVDKQTARKIMQELFS